MKEMSVNDMKQLLLMISEEAAQELLLSIPNEHINKERVMNTNKFQFDMIQFNLVSPRVFSSELSCRALETAICSLVSAG